MKNTFYRYRPVTIIKDSYIALKNGELKQFRGKTIIDELKNREIYFASIKENNDPIDGRLITFFQGDKINWICFLRNYCFSMLNIFTMISIIGDDKEIDDETFKKYISPYLTDECQNIPLYKDVFEEIFKIFLLDKSVQEITNAINFVDKLYLEEIENLFWYINKIFSFYMKEYYKNSKFKDIAKLIYIKEIDSIHNINFEDLFKNNKKEFDITFKIIKDLTKGLDLKLLLDQEEIKAQKNYKINLTQVNFNFNKKYFEQLLNLNFKEYYIACFSKQPDIDLLWSHYADKHKGICLIFETNDNSEINFSNSYNLKFKKINYKSKNIEINFFEYLGQYSKSILINTWFSYNTNYSPKIEIYNDKNNFHKTYWNLFEKKITLKTPHWKYEKEYRLILSNMSKEKRLLQYNQEHLVGIIFGENTDIKLKKEIIKTMKKILTPDQFNNFQWKECSYNSITKKLEINSLILPF